MSVVVRYKKPPQLSQLGARHAVVEASAGTGKTYLLEHLVVDLLIDHGATIDQILVVTFTEKATAELVDRVRAKLAELAALTADAPGTEGAADSDCWRIDDRARARLREALFAFDRASIFTIHGFCQRLLREHAFLSHRLFDEEAIDEEQAFHAAFTETLRRDVTADPTLRRFLEVWQGGGGSLAHIERDLLKAQRGLASLSPPRPEALFPGSPDEAAIVAAAAAFATVPVPTDLGASLKKTKMHASTAKAAVTRFERLRAAAAACKSNADVPLLLAEVDTLEGEKRESGTWIEFLADELVRRVPLAPELAPLTDALVELRARAVDFSGALVARLLPLVAARLEARKREAGLYDFQDMLTLVARGLEGEGEGARALLTSLRGRYRHALIDEFQDTDEVQWSIFRRIFFDSDEGHVLTVIGDPKQAIYAFRGADVHTYLRARDQIVGAGGESVYLTENFRSTAPLIAAYNAILDQRAPFFPPAGGILYDHPVACGRRDLALTANDVPAPGLVVLDLETTLPNVLTWQVKRALLGRMATEMADLLSPTSALRFGRPGSAARLRPADIFVLTRTTRESREVGEALRAARIPFAYFKQEKLFGTIEAREVLDLLRAIADPEDVTARNRAFITPFFGLGLADLAACDDLDAADALLRLLYEWRALAEGGELETLFARIIDDSGVVCRELFFRDGERALTNYLHLFEILQEEAAHARLTLRELAQILGGYINGTRRPPGVGRDIQRLESDVDAVQIMTIHHAKGLEAPVVFLYGGFWPGPPNDVRVVHDADHQRRVRVGRQSSEEEARYRAEQDDEERRVLYVALTRAEARLYLPRFPEVFKQLRGCYRFVHERLRDLLGGFTAEETRALFHREPVACPGDPLPTLSPPLPATLAAWQPTADLLADDPSDDDRRTLAKSRAGFVTTSYSAVKRRHGGFVAAVETIEDPAADERAGEAPEAHVEAPDELPRGRLTGRFLHELLEELPLAPLAARPPLEVWAAQPEVVSLFERLRRRHDRRREHLPHARRLVHTALTAPVQLEEGVCIPALASAERSLREMEFLYPIPERAHPLLAGETGDASEASPFRIERGLVKGYIDLVFEHRGRVYVCDWKGDWLPQWGEAEVRTHCERNYGIQAQLYTLATLRFLGIPDRAAFDARWGGVLYGFLRGMNADDPRAGVYFRRPAWDEVMDWQQQMLGNDLWRLS